NRLVEVTNRAILEGLKKRIFGAPTTWVEELPSILCASRTTPKTPTGESPYSLAFGTEAVLPPDVVFPTLRIQTHDEETSNQQLHENLDLLEEKRVDAHLRMLAYRRAVAKLYNRRVRPRLVKMGYLVLWKAEVATRLGPVGSWLRTGRVLTESSKLSEKGLIHWQQWRDEYYRELGTFQIYKKFTHNMERCASSYINENTITKDVGNKIRLFPTRITK
ncbi:hypothetical protein BHM03_00025210, partial [Ensete ventricosum]